MRQPGADLIAHYLDLDRLPVRDRWSRKHADTQRRLCERFAAPVIAAVTCQDIKTEHTQKIVNAAPTAGEGDRVHRMLSALVTAGIEAGYLTSPRLARVHWQAGDRPLPAPAVSVAGESALEHGGTTNRPCVSSPRSPAMPPRTRPPCAPGSGILTGSSWRAGSTRCLICGGCERRSSAPSVSARHEVQMRIHHGRGARLTNAPAAPLTQITIIPRDQELRDDQAGRH
jgi:hypothetical protein